MYLSILFSVSRLIYLNIAEKLRIGIRPFNKVMTPFTIILALSVANNNVYSSANIPSTSTSNQLQRYTCENQAYNNMGDDTRTIYPVWIRSWNDTHNNIGILETPNFPNRFPLPLRCVWIFDNNVMTNTDDKQKLFIYFTRVIITFYRHCFLYSRHKVL